MTITLPDEMRDELERKAKAAGFPTVDEYVADQLSIAGEAPINIPNPRADARYSIRTRGELEAKLLEGMNREGDVVAGPDFWDQRRSAAEERARTSGPELASPTQPPLRQTSITSKTTCCVLAPMCSNCSTSGWRDHSISTSDSRLPPKSISLRAHISPG